MIALRQARAILIPLVLAWMFSQLLAPMVKAFAKRRIPTSLAAILALIFMLVIFFWVTMFISLSAASLLNKLPAYSEKAAGLVANIVQGLSERFKILSNEAVQSEIRKEVTGMVGFTMSIIGNFAGLLTSWMAKLVLIFIMTAFMLVAQPYTERKIANAFPPNTASRISRIIATISTQMSHYLVIQFILSLATGLLVWMSCRIVGVDAAMTWGALAFFLNFIPTIGSIVAAVPPILLALLQFPTVWPAFWLLLAILAINQVIGNIISPLLMGDRFNMSPTAILLSLLFWGWLWGVPGAFLSVIIASAFKIVCENIDILRPISVLMESGKLMPAVPTKPVPREEVEPGT